MKIITNKKTVLSFLMMLLISGAVQAQPQQGLMNRLIEIKYSSELYLTSTLKNDQLDQSRKDSALAIYNTMRWMVDGWVYQLGSDLITANSTRQFKRINANYAEDLNEINAFYEKHIQPKIYNQPRTLNLTTNVFYLLKDSYSIIKGLSDLKTRKTMAIVELLDHARLLSPGEVVKGVK
ncbi:MAG: hypothetical protein ACKOWO_09485 [Sediminibacterium sp.]